MNFSNWLLSYTTANQRQKMLRRTCNKLSTKSKAWVKIATLLSGIGFLRSITRWMQFSFLISITNKIRPPLRKSSLRGESEQFTIESKLLKSSRSSSLACSKSLLTVLIKIFPSSAIKYQNASLILKFSINFITKSGLASNSRDQSSSRAT